MNCLPFIACDLRLTRRFVLVLAVVLPTPPGRMKLREATSGRLSSNPVTRIGGVSEYWSNALFQNCTPRTWDWECSQGTALRSGRTVRPGIKSGSLTSL